MSAGEQIIVLGSPGRSTFFKWKAAPQSARLARDTLERLSLILGIYKALQILLPEPHTADTWIKRPNSAPPFGERAALDRMLAGNIGDPRSANISRHLATRCEAAGRDGTQSDYQPGANAGRTAPWTGRLPIA